MPFADPTNPLLAAGGLTGPTLAVGLLVIGGVAILLIAVVARIARRAAVGPAGGKRVPPAGAGVDPWREAGRRLRVEEHGGSDGDRSGERR
jgi:hypothetical protein